MNRTRYDDSNPKVYLLSGVTLSFLGQPDRLREREA